MGVLTIIGIVLLVVLRLLMLASPRFTGNVLSKKWQQWLLGDPRNGKSPHPGNIT